MKNELNIETDSNNIYAEFNLKAEKASKITFGVLILIIFGILFGLLLTSKSSDLTSMVLPGFFIVSSLGFCIKYLFWNIYGQEVIVINSNSISYSKNYGFFKTNLTSIIFDELNIVPTVFKVSFDNNPFMENEKLQISILKENGIRFFSKEVLNRENTLPIDVSGLPIGAYTVLIQGEKNRITKRLLIEN